MFVFLVLVFCVESFFILHTVDQLCDFFSLFFSLLSVWHLLNLSGVYWCNNWCLHPSPPHTHTHPTPSHPSAALLCSLCPHTMNTLASRLPNQLSRWEEGKSNLTAATRRGDCFFLSVTEKQVQRRCASGCDGGKEAKGEKWKLLGCGSWTVALPRWSSCTHSPHPTSTLLALAVSRSALSRPDTADQSPGDTRDHIPASSSLGEAEQ